MAWEEAGEATSGPPLPSPDPFPFTREGRLFERIEHELSLTQAVLKVSGLVLEKSAIQAKRRARKRSPTSA
jgi:hypothetical protein